ncbi:predicted protein [Naegleria gruberi]|uniref:Predicted protein n=1 Tax=Naegleria gruberi TaxID=5762 RepID=D2W0J1_NAEGR|nr:uncharacterized protein NAEGRDRAFT_74877 [Naegleria gruberi]EFC37438.1 predicted protein [Naegleria gruberi]|eukprot:XP_002670182.1 predicted protein [Naegleria gruberi strain NEG-M]
MAVASKKTISILKYDSKESTFKFIQEVVLSDEVKSLNWSREKLCVGLKKEYSLIDLQKLPIGHQKVMDYVNRVQQNTFGLSLPNETVLSVNKIGVFIDSSGSKCRYITWSEVPNMVAYLNPFLIAVLSAGLEVRILHDQLTSETLVQNIPLKDEIIAMSQQNFIDFDNPQNIDRGMGVGSTSRDKIDRDDEIDPSNRCFLASKDAIYVIVMKQFDYQAGELLHNQQFERTLQICEAVENSIYKLESWRIEAIHTEYGFYLVTNGDFGKAMVHFSKGNVDPRMIISLFPDLIPRSIVYRDSFFLPYTPEEKQKIELFLADTEQRKTGLQALVQYLLNIRKDLDKYFIETVDTSLLKALVLTNDPRTEEFISQPNHCNISESLSFILCDDQNFRELVLFCKTKDLHAKEQQLLKLLEEKEFLLSILKKNGLSLEYAPICYRNDRKIVLEAFKQNEKALKYASQELKGDKILKLHTSIVHVVDFVYLEEEGLYNLLSKTIDSNIIGFNDDESDNASELPPSECSLEFVQTCIVIWILKLIGENYLQVEANITETIDYFLFCMNLETLLKDRIQKITKRSKLVETINDISNEFSFHAYSEHEYSSIIYLLYKTNGKDIKSILSEYRNTTGTTHRVLTAAIIFRENSSFKRYHLLSTLGYGAEGVVFKAFDLELKETFAIKIKFESEYDLDHTKKRIEFLKQDIEGKIKCFDCGIIEFGHLKTKHLYTIMEMGDESLRKIIGKNNINQKTMEKSHLIEILEIFSKILYSVQTIHNHNIAHRDLDPNNIVKVNDTFKIIDFDQSRVVELGKSITINVGKYSYMAPEVSDNTYEEENRQDLTYDSKLIQNREVSTSCDIFSMGCIFLELLTNCPLRLDKGFINGTDLSLFNEKHRYFTYDGLYFHSAVVTLEGELKLHHAIKLWIDNHINNQFGVNEIITRCLISMIQRNAKKRLDCFTYKLIIDSVINYLKGEITDLSMAIENEMKELREVRPLLNYSEMIQENFNLQKDVDMLRKENEKLKLELEELRRENKKLH